MNIAIPKTLGHIWIGPFSAPTHWFNTWKDKHPEWKYVLYDNEFLNNFKFKTHLQIQEYLKRGDYAGVADLMRYEILYEYGGLIAEADSICYHNTDELWTKPCAYTVYENEFSKGKLVSPILASEPKNKFLKSLIDKLAETNPKELDAPWRSTGNLFVAQMIEELSPEIIIFPSHYFIPIHFDGLIYEGKDKVYAKQLFGTTQNSYKTERTSINKNKLWQIVMDKIYYRKLRRKQRKETLNYRLEAQERAAKMRKQLFEIDYSRH